ncbi:hypothetical protein MMC32_003708 [Xylographa parallela]|nr:hypothetical protein [Xylographa parallela]
MAFSSQDNFLHHEITTGDLTTRRFSLHKFSYSTIPVGHKAAAWSHLKADNLSAVFDHVSSKAGEGQIEKRPIISILQGGDTLEVICLKDLHQQVRIDEARLGGSQASDSSRNILIIIRKPLVSFRFRLPNGETRRLQLNFAVECGYEYTVKTLLATNLPIRDQNVQIESSVLSQTTIGSHKSTAQDYNLSRPLTSAAFTETSNTEVNVQCDMNSSLSMRPPTSDNYGDTPTISASYPWVPSSAGRLEKRSGFDRASGSYQVQPEPSQHPQVSASSAYRRDNQESIIAEEPEILRPSSAPVTSVNMSIDMLSQILPPKRQLPFAIVPAKRPRPEADSSATVGESAPSLEVVLKVRNDSAKVAPKRVPTQRAKPKKSPRNTARPKVSIAKKVSSKEVATQRANLGGVTSEQDPPGEVTSRRVLPEPPTPTSVAFTTANTTQDKPARFTRSSSGTHASQKTLSQSSKPSSQEATSNNAILAVPHAALKDAITQTTAVNVPQLFMPVSGNANAAPRLELSQEWVDQVEKHIREARCRSIPEPVSESALVLSNRPIARSDLQVYATRPRKERQAGLSYTIIDAIMDENFVALCEDVEKVLEVMLKGR